MTFARLTLIAAAVASITACGKKEQAPAAQQNQMPATATAPAKDDRLIVKIGHVAPLTGSIAHLGKDNENGARLAVDEVNAQNPEIGGKKVKFELLSEDDQADPKSATTVAQKLIDKKVAGVVGHLNSGTTIPASPLYNAAGIPQISPSATNPKYTQQGFKTAYRVIANDVAQGNALGLFAADTLKAKKIAIIDDKTAYGQGLADEFEKSVKGKGIEVVAHESTQNDKTDFKAILTNIKAKKPDIIFFGGMDAQGGPMTQQMKQLGITAKLLGGDGLQSPEFIKLAADAAEGQYASSPGQPKEKLPGFDEFNKKYKAKFNSEVQIYGPYTYDAVMVMVDAMKRANSTEPAKYLAELPKTDREGVTGRLKFDDKGDIIGGSITVYQVKGGKWEMLTTVGGPAPAKPDEAKK